MMAGRANLLRSVDDAVLPVIAWIHEALRSERGQTLAEYSLIMTVVAVGVVVAGLILFRTQIAAAFGAVTGCLDGDC